MSTVKNYIMSLRSVNLFFADGTFRAIPVENPMYNDLKDLLLAHDYQGAANLADIAGNLQAHSSGKFYVNNGLIVIGKDTLPDALSKRIIQFADNGLDFDPLLAFWHNVKKNPSSESVRDLWAFLEHNDIPITVDGCFVGYKRVKENFESVTAGVWEKVEGSDDWSFNPNICYDHTPGKEVEMPREHVNADRNATCSSGLHVANYGYANDFYSGGNGKLVEIKVNPKDVVSCPIDYDNAKLRACKYEVVRECVGQRVNEPLYTEDASYNDEDDSDILPTSVVPDEIEAPVVPDDLFVEESDVNEATALEDKMEFVGELHPGSNGRLGIPAVMVKCLELEPGEVAYVKIMKNSMEITSANMSCNTAYKAYTVDKHYGLRVGRCLTRNYKMHNYDNTMIILYAC